MGRVMRGGLLVLLVFASLSCSTEQSSPTGEEARPAPKEVTKEVTRVVTVAEAPNQDEPAAPESERRPAAAPTPEPEPVDDAPSDEQYEPGTGAAEATLVSEEPTADQYDPASPSEPATGSGAPEAEGGTDASFVVGETASTDTGAEITVYSYEYVSPTDSWQPEPGFEYNAADIEACAGPEGSADSNPFDFGLQMPDNTRLQPDVGVKEPALHATTLPPGDCVRGYVTFQVPQGEAPTHIVFTAGSSIIKWAVQGVARGTTQYTPPDVPLTDQDISDEYNLEEQCAALGKVVAGRGCVFPEDASNVPLTDAEEGTDETKVSEPPPGDEEPVPPSTEPTDEPAPQYETAPTPTGEPLGGGGDVSEGTTAPEQY